MDKNTFQLQSVFLLKHVVRVIKKKRKKKSFISYFEDIETGQYWAFNKKWISLIPLLFSIFYFIFVFFETSDPKVRPAEWWVVTPELYLNKYYF